MNNPSQKMKAKWTYEQLNVETESFNPGFSRVARNINLGFLQSLLERWTLKRIGMPENITKFL